jgi:hypothetical protein
LPPEHSLLQRQIDHPLGDGQRHGGAAVDVLVSASSKLWSMAYMAISAAWWIRLPA